MGKKSKFSEKHIKTEMINSLLNDVTLGIHRTDITDYKYTIFKSETIICAFSSNSYRCWCCIGTLVALLQLENNHCKPQCTSFCNLFPCTILVSRILSYSFSWLGWGEHQKYVLLQALMALEGWHLLQSEMVCCQDCCWSSPIPYHLEIDSSTHIKSLGEKFLTWWLLKLLTKSLTNSQR